jgi:hypothetical protein
MIKYRLKDGIEAQWHKDVAAFIAAIESVPALAGKISYRCLKRRGTNEYFHIATPADDDAIKALQSQPFFAAYTKQTEHAAIDDKVEVFPLEIVAETKFRP